MYNRNNKEPRGKKCKHKNKKSSLLCSKGPQGGTPRLVRLRDTRISSIYFRGELAPKSTNGASSRTAPPAAGRKSTRCVCCHQSISLLILSFHRNRASNRLSWPFHTMVKGNAVKKAGGVAAAQEAEVLKQKKMAQKKKVQPEPEVSCGPPTLSLQHACCRAGVAACSARECT